MADKGTFRKQGGETDQGMNPSDIVRPIRRTIAGRRVLIFPGSFTHLHRGNPPYEAKYIATGWLASNDMGSPTILI